MQAVQAVFRSPLLLVWACFNAVCTRRGCSPNSSITSNQPHPLHMSRVVLQRASEPNRRCRCSWWCNVLTQGDKPGWGFLAHSNKHLMLLL